AFHFQVIVPAPTITASQGVDPPSNTRIPLCRSTILNVANHCSERMLGTMIACFEALDAARTRLFANDILAFVPSILFRCGETFALDGHQGIKIDVAAALDQNRARRRGSDQIDSPTTALLISFFDTKLQNVPSIQATARTVQMRANLRRQRCLRRFLPAVGAVPPHG